MTEAITTAQDREKWRNIVYFTTAVRDPECPDLIVVVVKWWQIIVEKLSENC